MCFLDWEKSNLHLGWELNIICWHATGNIYIYPLACRWGMYVCAWTPSHSGHPGLKWWWLLSDALLGLVFQSLIHAGNTRENFHVDLLIQSHCKGDRLFLWKTRPDLPSLDLSSLTFRKIPSMNFPLWPPCRAWEPSAGGISDSFILQVWCAKLCSFAQWIIKICL